MFVVFADKYVPRTLYTHEFTIACMHACCKKAASAKIKSAKGGGSYDIHASLHGLHCNNANLLAMAVQ